MARRGRRARSGGQVGQRHRLGARERYEERPPRPTVGTATPVSVGDREVPARSRAPRAPARSLPCPDDVRARPARLGDAAPPMVPTVTSREPGPCGGPRRAAPWQGGDDCGLRSGTCGAGANGPAGDGGSLRPPAHPSPGQVRSSAARACRGFAVSRAGDSLADVVGRMPLSRRRPLPGSHPSRAGDEDGDMDELPHRGGRRGRRPVLLHPRRETSRSLRCAWPSATGIHPTT